MRMKLDGGDRGGGVVVGDGKGLAAGSSAAVQDAQPFRTNARVDQVGDKLRGFVLDNDVAAAECLSLCDAPGDVPGLDATGGGEKRPWFERDSVLP